MREIKNHKGESMSITTDGYRQFPINLIIKILRKNLRNFIHLNRCCPICGIPMKEHDVCSKCEILCGGNHLSIIEDRGNMICDWCLDHERLNMVSTCDNCNLSGLVESLKSQIRGKRYNIAHKHFVNCSETHDNCMGCNELDRCLALYDMKCETGKINGYSENIKQYIGSGTQC